MFSPDLGSLLSVCVSSGGFRRFPLSQIFQNICPCLYIPNHHTTHNDKLTTARHHSSCAFSGLSCVQYSHGLLLQQHETNPACCQASLSFGEDAQIADSFLSSTRQHLNSEKKFLALQSSSNLKNQFQVL